MTHTKNTYCLPVAEENTLHVISDPRAHRGNTEHALDFIVPQGTPIMAARGGTIVDSKLSFTQGGADPLFLDKANYITIEHENDEYSQYVHLAPQEPIVQCGEKVSAGQIIALSGNTGYSTTPHLHFQVFRFHDDESWSTLAIAFENQPLVLRGPFH